MTVSITIDHFPSTHPYTSFPRQPLTTPASPRLILIYFTFVNLSTSTIITRSFIRHTRAHYFVFSRQFWVYPTLSFGRRGGSRESCSTQRRGLRPEKCTCLMNLCLARSAMLKASRKQTPYEYIHCARRERTISFFLPSHRMLYIRAIFSTLVVKASRAGNEIYFDEGRNRLIALCLVAAHIFNPTPGRCYTLVIYPRRRLCCARQTFMI